ncbi:MAG: DNA/RNA nuclease SfsA [Ruminococcaceae bacterium]|nr:DNA/RNA nuclease SfsA [Oscillospiraceae bacterium]
MHYPTDSVFPAIFLKRPNRFIAHCLLDNQEVVCHVKNTGRCRELLLPGAEIYLCKAPPESCRKTGYDLIAVRKENRLINIDAQAPNRAAYTFLANHWQEVRSEVTYGSSRVDFLVRNGDRKRFVEVKGVTLEENSDVFFPDAPTERGVKHLYELISAVRAGYEAAVLFVIQMEGVRSFSPNDRTDPAFGRALREACASGVEIMAYDCIVTPESMRLKTPVQICL